MEGTGTGTEMGTGKSLLAGERGQISICSGGFGEKYGYVLVYPLFGRQQLWTNPNTGIYKLCGDQWESCTLVMPINEHGHPERQYPRDSTQRVWSHQQSDRVVARPLLWCSQPEQAVWPGMLSGCDLLTLCTGKQGTVPTGNTAPYVVLLQDWFPKDEGNCESKLTVEDFAWKNTN